jgi:hypothetical protein
MAPRCHRYFSTITKTQFGIWKHSFKNCLEFVWYAPWIVSAKNGHLKNCSRIAWEWQGHCPCSNFSRANWRGGGGQICKKKLGIFYSFRDPKVSVSWLQKLKNIQEYRAFDWRLHEHFLDLSGQILNSDLIIRVLLIISTVFFTVKNCCKNSLSFGKRSRSDWIRIRNTDDVPLGIDCISVGLAGFLLKERWGLDEAYSDCWLRLSTTSKLGCARLTPHQNGIFNIKF